MPRLGMAVLAAFAIAGGALLATACSGRRTIATSEHSGEPEPAASAHPGTVESAAERAPEPPPEPPLTEAEARALLADRFRGAGYRVLYDVRVAEVGRFDVTLDGYDPAVRVGFEYVAVEERGTDLVPTEIGPLGASDHTILIVEAGAQAAVFAAAERFLAANPR